MIIRLRHKAGYNIIKEVGIRLYPRILDCIREAVSNTIDESSPKVDINISAKEIVIEDYGTGIKDPKKFAYFGQSLKEDDDDLIGSKGLGKLSYLRVSDTIEVLTNNGTKQFRLVMTLEGIDYEQVDKALDHVGTKIIMKKPKELFTVDELSKYLSIMFGFHIARGFQIRINKETVKTNPEVDFEENDLVTFKFKRLDYNDKTLVPIMGYATGNIKEDKKKSNGTLDVYVKHVFIKTLTVDPDRSFRGIVNCDFLTPTTNRNDLVNDDVLALFLRKMKEYVKRFPLKTKPTDISAEESRLKDEVSRMFTKYVKQNKFVLTTKTDRRGGLIKVMQKPQQQVTVEELVEEDEKIREQEKRQEEKTKKQLDELNKQKPIQRHEKDENGFHWIDQDWGDKKSPIFFLYPNIIVRNRTNSLYNFALEDKQSYGPKFFRYVYHMAHTAVQCTKNTEGMTANDICDEINKAVIFFLKEKKYIQ